MAVLCLPCSSTLTLDFSPDSPIERIAPFYVNPQMLLLTERLRQRKTKRAFLSVFVSLCLMGRNKGLKHLASYGSFLSFLHSKEITWVGLLLTQKHICIVKYSQ